MSDLTADIKTNRGTIHLRLFADKTPITVADSPGFASSRLGLVIGLEAMRMVEQGVASAADIDTAMKLGYGHPMGPLELTDLVGLDVRLKIAEYLSSAIGPAFNPPQVLRDKVDEGKPFGWATGYQVEQGGEASLRYHTSPLRWALLLIEVLAWLLALRALLRIRLDRSSGTVAVAAAPSSTGLTAVSSWGRGNVEGDDLAEGTHDGGGSAADDDEGTDEADHQDAVDGGAEDDGGDGP